MKRFLLTIAAILGLSSQQAGSKTQVSLDQLAAPTTTAIMVSVPGRGWVQAQLDPTITLNTATVPPTLAAPGATPFPTFVDGVTPTGNVDGVNNLFVLPSAPNPAVSLELSVGGLTYKAVTDYTLAGATLTMISAPASGSMISASYRR